MRIAQPMKRNTKLMAMAGVSAVAVSTLLAAPHGKHGTDILHFFVRKTMTNGGIETNAVGRVEADQNKQGNANNQRLKIVVNDLTPGATYQMLAQTGSDPNWNGITSFLVNTH